MSFKRFASTLFAAVVLGGAALASAAEAPLKLEVYNAGDKSLFSVASVLVEGKRDAVLIDAQFGRAEAEELAQKIRTSGKTLKAIYVSHGDPDYYFGLDTLHKAFPQAQILATKPTVDHILATKALKLAYWGPILKDNAPAEILVPQVLAGDRIDLEGNTLQVVGLDGPTPDRSFVWIPALKAVIGGIPVFGGLHVWMADTQTPRSHAQWLATLDRIAKLKPLTVVPGHFAPGSAQTLAAVDFTGDYIRAYDAEATKAKTSTQLIAAMKQRYPNLGAVSSLELSAKVSKGEMKWP